MTTLLQKIGAFFVPEASAVEAFASQVAGDVVAWATGVETLVVDDARAAWAVLKPILTSIGPAQWTILRGLVQDAAADAAAGDYGAIATVVLAQATTAETAFVTQIGTEVLGVLVSVLAYKGQA
jgi:hypothetical protein